MNMPQIEEKNQTNHPKVELKNAHSELQARW